MKDKKRALVYLLPRDGLFKVAFVFGKKATDKVSESNVSEAIKYELNQAKVYAEGRGVRIEIKDKTAIEDIKTFIAIKVTN